MADPLTCPPQPSTPAHAQWQEEEHSLRFDFRHALDDRNLIRIYETLNDVRLLKEWLAPTARATLLEVGCATGDFYRYLRLTRPLVEYYGADISMPAIERARGKYPQGRFLLGVEGEVPRLFREASGRQMAQIVYSKDVAHHQADPLAFIHRLLPLASEAVILRCRTRDVGPTETDPERSKQFQSSGWVPYMVLNLEELIENLRSRAPKGDIRVYRSYGVLGGKLGRVLPPECSLKGTGTAETAVGIFFRSRRPGGVRVVNRADNRPNTTWDYKWKGLVRRMRSATHG